MSIPMSVQAPAIVLPVGVEDTRGPSRVTRGRTDPRDQPTSVVLAYRDVVDEVRRRMARLGIQWE